jgi:uncharacterized delta-60 repeat protein
MTRPGALASLFLVALIGIFLPAAAQDYSLDPSFNPTFGGRTHPNFDFNSAVAIQPDQKILVGGNFTTVNGEPSALIVRLNPNGSRDTSFNSALGFTTFSEVGLITLLPDGKMLVAGTFQLGGNEVSLVRLNSDGSLDGTFSAAKQGRIKSLELYADGRFLVCGSFWPQTGAGLLARLNPNGSLDTSFSTDLNGLYCFDTETLPDGRIYVGGSMTVAGGMEIKGIVRLNANGSRDTSFAPFLPEHAYEFYKLALLPDGRLFAAVRFSYEDANGQQVARGFYRVMPTGGMQEIANCPDAEISYQLFVQSDGKIINSMCRPPLPSPYYGFARLLPDGSFDSSLNYLNFDNLVKHVARQADGNYVVVGQFFNVNGIPRQRIARLLAVPVTARHRFDFDGDGRDDLGVFRPSDRVWYVNRSTAGFAFNQWGLSSDKMVAADYDNDGKADIGVFRDGFWYALTSSNNTLLVHSFGQAGDKPFVGDMDGDGRVDLVTRRVLPNNSIQWQVRYFGATGTSATQTVGNETVTDRPLVADLDGDGADECAFYRNGIWFSRKANAGAPLRAFYWGIAGDIPAPGDYDLDGQMDTAVFRPSTGDWHINATTSGYTAIHFGATGDVPVPADYDGDGKTDIAVFRNGAWYQLLSGTGVFGGHAWGLAGDLPIPAQAY